MIEGLHQPYDILGASSQTGKRLDNDNRIPCCQSFKQFLKIGSIELGAGRFLVVDVINTVE